MPTQIELVDDGNPPPGTWDYYGGGYTIGEAINYTQVNSASQVNSVQQNLYYATLANLTGQDSFFNLDWIPTYGRYNGNGANDAWIRWQAWNYVNGDGRTLVRGPEDAAYIRAAMAEYIRQHPNDDPYGLKPVDQTDWNGFNHDLSSFGGAVTHIIGNITYAVGNLVQTLLTGNLYALASVPFIGAIASVYHTAVGIGGAIGAVGGGLASAGSSLFGGFSGAISNMMSGNFSGALNSIVSGISNAFSALGNALENAFKALFPVVIDLDGDGVELLSVAHSDLQIDAGFGDLRYTGWVGADDGLLAFDANGNGTVDGYAEFGLTNFSPTAGSDLEALAVFDSNGDGVLDAQDELFASFLIWRDLNGDGLCQDGEAMTLAELGVISINLALNGAASTNAGNFIANTTTVVMADGTVRDAADVAFASSGASDQARMIEVNVSSHVLAEGLELVTVSNGAGDVVLDVEDLDANTDLLVVGAAQEGGRITVHGDVATTFLGGLGDDTFVGGDAGSTFMGGGGDNLFIGGEGDDTYMIDSGNSGFDTIANTDGADTFVLNGSFAFEVVDGDLFIRSTESDYGVRVIDWATTGANDTLLLNGETVDVSSLLAPTDPDWMLAA
ncbi:hypothetical protein [Brevundimonas sp.]|uniref:hypothetical protein n=1 Tax=Brevundimonas sp. TaxID=1871086 RepID=UPI003F6E76C8